MIRLFLAILVVSVSTLAYADAVYTKDGSGNVIKTESTIVPKLELTKIIDGFKEERQQCIDKSLRLQDELISFNLSIATRTAKINDLDAEVAALQAQIDALEALK